MRHLSAIARCLTFCAVVACSPLLTAQGDAKQNLDPEQALDELRSKRDDADLSMPEQAAKANSDAAARGLASVYDQIRTIAMRRAFVRALSLLAEQKDSAPAACEKLANIAANAPEDEVRDPAVLGLGRSAEFGKGLLKQMVDSRVEDHVRELAIEQHKKLADASDVAWYRELWNLEQKQKKAEDGTLLPPEFAGIRLRAFTHLSASLTEEELVETLRREPLSKIRRAALLAMNDRSMPKTAEMAAWMLERVDLPGPDRAEAAKILIDRDGAKAVAQFLALAKKRDVTPEDLRFRMATLIADLRDDATEKKVGKLVGKGKEHEKAFALVAASRIKDPKVQAAIRKSLEDKEDEVRRSAARVIARNGDQEAVPDLRKMLVKSKVAADRSLAIETLGALSQGNSKWLDELREFAKDQEREVRNQALLQIAASRTKSLLPTLAEALSHDDASTRRIAVDGMLQLRIAGCVGPLVDRIGKEDGRLKKEIEEALWRLTAQPWGDDAKAWQAWWETAKVDFRCVTDDEFDKAARAKEQKRQLQRTVASAKFFGIKVDSTRVTFVIDVSGSMLEAMYGRMVNDQRATRIEVAKQELSLAVANLQENAWFNILAFSSGVEPWREGAMCKGTKADRDEAQIWISRLGASGGTNLYDSLQQAFKDPDVDTVFVMSDGEPTVGQQVDPFRIREDVAAWNQNRKITIHTIAIGGTLEILEWIAKDSGGSHQHLR